MRCQRRWPSFTDVIAQRRRQERIGKRLRRAIAPRGGLAGTALAAFLSLSCSVSDNFLGYDVLTSIGDDAGDTGPDAEVPDADGPDTDASDLVPDAGEPVTFNTASVPPNVFDPIVGASDTMVLEHAEAAFQQLFYGDESNERIYFESDDGSEAYIWDVNNDDTRADALGYGMMICVQLNHQTEFDKIWTFAKNNFQYTSGALAGYFRPICEIDLSACEAGTAQLGAHYIATALFFAEGRWGNGTGIYDYGTEARAIVDTMLNKESQNGGIVDDVTNMVNLDDDLPQRTPTVSDRNIAAPGSVVPAFFETWASATKNPVWLDVAMASREFLKQAVHPSTGLAPEASYHDGTVVEGSEDFRETSYGVGLQLSLDHSWYGLDPQQIDIANRVINFFAGLDEPYPRRYSYSGMPQDSITSYALISVNGATAGISTAPSRGDFIRRVWEMEIPTGVYRFFDGANHLLSLMYLGGVFRVY